MRYLLLFLFLHFCFCLTAQHQDKVDFTHAEIAIHPISENKQIKGTVIYRFDVLKSVDSVFLDAKNMTFSSVKLNYKKVRFLNDRKTITIKRKFKKGKSYQLELNYSTKPKQTVYYLGWHEGDLFNNQIWTQGQGKYTSYWLPSFDDMNEKVEFDLSISFDKNYQVIANGKLIKESPRPDHRVMWSFDMKGPMSSYLLAFVIGKYKKQLVTSASGIPIENYYYPQDSLRVEPTYRYTKRIFDFLETEIGVPYPWQNYKQIPVRDFLYAGMENTGATIFSDRYVIDSIAFVDKNYVNVNAHELAHQWFGNLVTEKDGSHHWLQEGFATYYAMLAEKEIFGEEFFYWKLYDTAKLLNSLSKDDNAEALTDPGASSLTFYEKGAWALYMLQNEVGDEAFKAGIQNYLEKYKFKNVTITDFITEIEQTSNQDLSSFKTLWLYGTEFPFEKAKENLIKNSVPIKDIFKLKWELTTSLSDNEHIIQGYWESTESIELKKRIILKYHKSLSSEFLHRAFETNNVQIRKALSTLPRNYTSLLKEDYESLLNDQSYSTVENALYRLWANFPKSKVDYLNRTKGVIGLPNKNIRQLWLLLAVLTKKYQEDGPKQEYLTELVGYTFPRYSFEVRQLAFELTYQFFELPDECLKNLINASMHHSWQFRKYARALLDKLIADGEQKERIIELFEDLNETELRYINSKIQAK
ncbi:MAG: M1 family metallopeptidase [Flavobacteriaceae bacterium]